MTVTANGHQAPGAAPVAGLGDYQPTGLNGAHASPAVNPAFTGKRKRDKPTEDWGKFMGRLARAYMRRAAAEDPWVVVDMLGTIEDMQAQADMAVLSLIKRGYSYGDIAAEFTRDGRPMTKQNVSQRWGKMWREMNDADREQVPA